MTLGGIWPAACWRLNWDALDGNSSAYPAVYCCPETVAGEVLLLLLLAWCPAVPNFMYLHHVGIYVNELNFPDD